MKTTTKTVRVVRGLNEHCLPTGIVGKIVATREAGAKVRVEVAHPRGGTYCAWISTSRVEVAS